MATTKGVSSKARTERMILGSLDDPICKKCPHRIRKGEARVWLTDPMGLSHEQCP